MTPEEFEERTAKKVNYWLRTEVSGAIYHDFLQEEDEKAAKIAILWAAMELIEPNKAMLLKMIQGE